MDTAGTLIMPPGSSTIAPDVDALFNFILYGGLVFFVIVVFIIFFFATRYHSKAKDTLTPDLSHNFKLELIWSIIPTILVIIVFFWGFRLFMKMHVVPKDAYEIKVTGQKWFWTFDYPNGATTVNDLTVPAGKPIKLLMSSKDVIHSFFVPDFRIKMDVLPNRYTVTWFEAESVGGHNLFCAEYCGKSHSDMIGRVNVVGEREFAAWLESSAVSGEGMSLDEYGEQLFRTKACVTCHKVDGGAHTGPPLNKIFGIERGLADGTVLTIDENYLRESIVNPRAKVVAGYQPVMPTFQGILNNRQVDALIAYIKSLEE
ncbi:MAG: cytochrome c oxidase subunit II [Candidatus Zixiibacteriota bacterium]